MRALKAEREYILNNRKKFVLYLCILLLSFLLWPFPVGTQAAENKKIRVGYPIQRGLTEIDKDGALVGYNYDYLQEISQHTGWEYEFVQIPGDINESLNTLLVMLENGEIDLLGSMVYSEQLGERYEYADSGYGVAYSVLSVLSDNTEINETNYYSMAPLRVAILENAKKDTERLLEYCTLNQINVELIPCKDDTELLQALRDGRADALLSRDVTFIADTRPIAHFSPITFYFASTKGNNEIIEELNSAQEMINNTDPYFMTELYQKHFNGGRAPFRLTSAEKQYVSSLGVITVAAEKDRAPFIEYSEKAGQWQGISVDILNHISDKTGLQFTFVETSSSEETMELLQEGQVQLAADVLYDYSLADTYGFSLTRPYISAQGVVAAYKGRDIDAMQSRRAAVPRGLNYLGGEDNIVRFDSILDCLRAVNKGEADYCYGNSYSIQYYFNRFHFENLTLIPQTEDSYFLSFGMAQPVDTTLLTILNKAVLDISQEELQSMIYRNTIRIEQNVTLWSVVEANPKKAFTYLFLVMLVVGCLLSAFAWRQRKARRRSEVENERYRLLSELSGEYLFEYDYETDMLVLTQKTANWFQTSCVQEKFYEKVLQSCKRFQWVRQLYEQILTNKHLTWEKQIEMPDGTLRWLRVVLTVVQDSKNLPVCAIGKVVDIQEEMEEKDALSRRANLDGLTGLYNASYARSRVEELLSGEKSSYGTMFILDIDCFKNVNDQFGHFMGDQVLKKTAEILCNVFRSNDILGRLGGDEFLVFMTGMASEEIVARKCRMIQEKAKGAFPFIDTDVTFSIGACRADGQIPYDILYQKADSALYRVKNKGRNGFSIEAEDESQKMKKEEGKV